MKAHRNILAALILLTLILPVTAGEFPDNWYWERPVEHTKFEGLEAPASALATGLVASSM